MANGFPMGTFLLQGIAEQQSPLSCAARLRRPTALACPSQRALYPLLRLHRRSLALCSASGEVDSLRSCCHAQTTRGRAQPAATARACAQAPRPSCSGSRHSRRGCRRRRTMVAPRRAARGGPLAGRTRREGRRRGARRACVWPAVCGSVGDAAGCRPSLAHARAISLAAPSGAALRGGPTRRSEGSLRCSRGRLRGESSRTRSSRRRSRLQ